MILKFSLQKEVTKYYNLDIFAKEIIYVTFDDVLSEYESTKEIEKLLYRIKNVDKGSVDTKNRPFKQKWEKYICMI